MASGSSKEIILFLVYRRECKPLRSAIEAAGFKLEGSSVVLTHLDVAAPLLNSRHSASLYLNTAKISSFFLLL